MKLTVARNALYITSNIEAHEYVFLKNFVDISFFISAKSSRRPLSILLLY